MEPFVYVGVLLVLFIFLLQYWMSMLMFFKSARTCRFLSCVLNDVAFFRRNPYLCSSRWFIILGFYRFIWTWEMKQWKWMEKKIEVYKTANQSIDRSKGLVELINQSDEQRRALSSFRRLFLNKNTINRESAFFYFDIPRNYGKKINKPIKGAQFNKSLRLIDWLIDWFGVTPKHDCFTWNKKEDSQDSGHPTPKNASKFH